MNDPRELPGAEEKRAAQLSELAAGLLHVAQMPKSALSDGFLAEIRAALSRVMKQE